MQMKSFQGVLLLAGIFVLAAVLLGFFASIGIWAAVSFLKVFGIKTLAPCA